MSRQIAYLPYNRTFREPLRTAHGEWAVREGFVVRIEEDGEVGYGEVAPIPDFGSETVAKAGSFLKTLVQNPKLAVPMDLPCCAFAVSAACTQASAEGFATDGRVVPTYPVSALLPAGIAAVDAMRTKAAGGYSTFKWKIGVEPLSVELEIFQRLLSVLPEGGQLRLDANAGLDEAELLSWLDAASVAANQVEYIEQPLAVGQELRMAKHMDSSGVPIALDESLNGPQGNQWLVDWAGPLVVKPALMGDIEQLHSQLVAVADRVVISSVFETSVGMVNAMHFAAQIGATKRAIGFDTLDAFGDALQLFTSAPQLTLQHVGRSQLDQLWQTLLHSK